MNEIVLKQFTMSAGPNAAWGGPAPKAQVVETSRDGRKVFAARTPWGEDFYADYDDAEDAAKRVANR